jgi:hypothetical protein
VRVSPFVAPQRAHWRALAAPFVAALLGIFDRGFTVRLFFSRRVQPRSPKAYHDFRGQDPRRESDALSLHPLRTVAIPAD